MKNAEYLYAPFLWHQYCFFIFIIFFLLARSAFPAGSLRVPLYAWGCLHLFSFHPPPSIYYRALPVSKRNVSENIDTYLTSPQTKKSAESLPPRQAAVFGPSFFFVLYIRCKTGFLGPFILVFFSPEAGSATHRARTT